MGLVLLSTIINEEEEYEVEEVQSIENKKRNAIPGTLKGLQDEHINR